MTTELNVVEGMQFDRGYVSPYLVTNTDKMSAELDNPVILITDKKSAIFKNFFRFWSKCLKTA